MSPRNGYKYATRFPILCRKCEKLQKPIREEDLCWGCFDFYNDLKTPHVRRVEPDAVVVENILFEGPQAGALRCEKRIAAMRLLESEEYVDRAEIARRVGVTERSVDRWALKAQPRPGMIDRLLAEGATRHSKATRKERLLAAGVLLGRGQELGWVDAWLDLGSVRASAREAVRS